MRSIVSQCISDLSIRFSEILNDELHDCENRGDSYEDVIWRLVETANAYESESPE